MADTVVAPVVVPVASAAPVAAPAVVETAPAVAPVATVVPPPVPPVVAGAEPVIEAPKAEPAPAAVEPAKPTSFLGDAPKPDTKPVEPVKAAEPTKLGEPVVAEPAAEAAPITYEPFTVPEGQALDPDRLGEFTKVLAEAKAPQELGQKMVDLYYAEMDRVSRYQQEIWDRTQEQWLDQVRSDPEIGGSRIETVAKTCGAVMERYGSQELRDALTLTGMGNHPALIRFFNKIGTFLNEGKPVPAVKPVPTVSRKGIGRYANSVSPPST